MGCGPDRRGAEAAGPLDLWRVGQPYLVFSGDDDRADVNATLLQPFLSDTTPQAWTFSLNTESTYDWESEQWSVPLNGVVTKATKIGSQLVSIGAGARYWAEGPDGGAEGSGARLVFTLLFPK